MGTEGEITLWAQGRSYTETWRDLGLGWGGTPVRLEREEGAVYHAKGLRLTPF